MDESDPFDDLTDEERAAVERTEHAIEWFRRAHGSLVQFHHEIGHAMEHVAEVEDRLDGSHDEIATRLREEVLTAGVTADDKFTYELLAEFEDGLLADAESVADETFETVAGGEHHPLARRKRRERED